jgi:hypothetical protein
LEYLEDTNVVYPKKMEHPQTERRGEERDTKKRRKRNNGSKSKYNIRETKLTAASPLHYLPSLPPITPFPSSL